jgi:hypothetical protein
MFAHLSNKRLLALRIHVQRRILGEIISKSDIPDHIDQVSLTAGNLISVLEAALTDCFNMPLCWLKCDGEASIVDMLRRLMHALALGFASSFEALNELGRTIPGRAKRFRIEYSLLTFFKQGLDYLRTISALQAEGYQTPKERGQPNKRAKVEGSQYAVNNYLSRALTRMTQMDWKTGNLSHSEFLEGILCLILRHTGELLSLTVFDEHVAKSGNPGKISSGHSVSKTKATNYEFRYIAGILHAALGGQKNNELISKILEERRSGRSASLSGDTLLKAKQLLQNTLVKSTIGVEVEVLRLVDQPEGFEPYSLGVSHRGKQYGPEWFMEAVWGLVGWELATSKD